MPGPLHIPGRVSRGLFAKKMIDALAGREGKVGGLARLLKVFLPYLVQNTVVRTTRAWWPKWVGSPQRSLSSIACRC